MLNQWEKTLRIKGISPFYFLLVMTLLLSGCFTSMNGTKEEVQHSNPNEGIVLGSVVISADEGKDDSSFSFLKGGKADDYDYELFFAREDNDHSIVLSKKYSLKVKPNREEYFAKSLPQGKYKIYQMHANKFSFFAPSNLIIYTQLSFMVKGGEPTYIGTLFITIPSRMKGGTSVLFRVEDAQEKTIEALSEQYGQIHEVKKGLIIFDRN